MNAKEIVEQMIECLGGTQNIITVILAPDFPPELKYSESEGWFGLTSEGVRCAIGSAWRLAG